MEAGASTSGAGVPAEPPRIAVGCGYRCGGPRRRATARGVAGAGRVRRWRVRAAAAGEASSRRPQVPRTEACCAADRFPSVDMTVVSTPGPRMEPATGVENARGAFATPCRVEQARFPHRLGRHKTPPTRSTGKIAVLFEHYVTGRTRAPVAKPMGGNSPTNVAALRRAFTFAGIRVHVRRNPCSRSPDPVFNFTGMRN